MPGLAFPQCPLLLALKNPFRCTLKKKRNKKCKALKVTRKGNGFYGASPRIPASCEMHSFLEGGKYRAKIADCSVLELINLVSEVA